MIIDTVSLRLDYQRTLSRVRGRIASVLAIAVMMHFS